MRVSPAVDVGGGRESEAVPIIILCRNSARLWLLSASFFFIFRFYFQVLIPGFNSGLSLFSHVTDNRPFL